VPRRSLAPSGPGRTPTPLSVPSARARRASWCWNRAATCAFAAPACRCCPRRAAPSAAPPSRAPSASSCEAFATGSLCSRKSFAEPQVERTYYPFDAALNVTHACRSSRALASLVPCALSGRNMASGPPGLGGMTGILNWRALSRAAFAAGTACKLQAAYLQVSVPMKAIADILPRSLAHSDGTAPSRPLTAEDRKWFYEAMAVRPPSALPSRSRPPTPALTPPPVRRPRWTQWRR